MTEEHTATRRNCDHEKADKNKVSDTGLIEK